MVQKNTSRRWDLQSEVPPPIGGEISNWRWDLWLEVTPPIGGVISNWRWHPWSEVVPAIGDEISNWRWDLWLEVLPLMVGKISNWRWDLQLEVRSPIGGTHVTCRNQLFFWKKRDYLLLITSSRHLSTRWNVNLFSFIFKPAVADLLTITPVYVCLYVRVWLWTTYLLDSCVKTIGTLLCYNTVGHFIVSCIYDIWRHHYIITSLRCHNMTTTSWCH